MLIQWRYKIRRKFSTILDDILGEEETSQFQKCKPYPDNFKLYKGTTRKYDYFDYSGHKKNIEVTIADKTCILEELGFIKFISNRRIDE